MDLKDEGLVAVEMYLEEIRGHESGVKRMGFLVSQSRSCLSSSSSPPPWNRVT